MLQLLLHLRTNSSSQTYSAGHLYNLEQEPNLHLSLILRSQPFLRKGGHDRLNLTQHHIEPESGPNKLRKRGKGGGEEERKNGRGGKERGAEERRERTGGEERRGEQKGGEKEREGRKGEGIHVQKITNTPNRSPEEIKLKTESITCMMDS
eukprot:745706-Hanusia_phi.AAC.3